MNAKVKEFWDHQALAFGASDEATAPDRYYRALEIENICPWIPGSLTSDAPSVLDIGCGNGYSTKIFAEAHPDCQFLGLDYSEQMIAQAVPGRNHTYRVGNVLSLPEQRFDTIISERCIINLANWAEQEQAILQMLDHLNPGGRIILVENFTQGLGNLNNLRNEFGLHQIEQRWHNCYIDDTTFHNFVINRLVIDFRENIGNLYYVISRVVYPALAKETGEEIRYDHPLNKIAALLPTLGRFSDFSPNWMYVLRAK